MIQEAFLSMGAGHGRSGKPLKPKGLVIHYVGNAGSSAMANRNYFESGSGGNHVSAHYIVGLHGEVLQCLPETERAAHAGKAYAEKYREMVKTNNSTYLGIEVCHPHSDGRFATETYRSLVKLAAGICHWYGFDIFTQVLRHYDVCGKTCPAYYVVNPAEWNKLRNAIYSGTLVNKCLQYGCKIDLPYWERVQAGEILADMEYVRILEERISDAQ